MVFWPKAMFIVVWGTAPGPNRKRRFLAEGQANVAVAGALPQATVRHGVLPDNSTLVYANQR